MREGEEADVDAAFLAAFSPASLLIPLAGTRAVGGGVWGVDRPITPHIQLPNGVVRPLTRAERRRAAWLIARRRNFPEF